MKVRAQQIITKINAVETMPQLDELRPEVAEEMMKDGEESFNTIQGEFIKAKNRLKRIPLSKRSW